MNTLYNCPWVSVIRHEGERIKFPCGNDEDQKRPCVSSPSVSEGSMTLSDEPALADARATDTTAFGYEELIEYFFSKFRAITSL